MPPCIYSSTAGLKNSSSSPYSSPTRDQHYFFFLHSISLEWFEREAWTKYNMEKEILTKLTSLDKHVQSLENFLHFEMHEDPSRG